MAEKKKDRRVCLDISSRKTIPSLAGRLNMPNFFTHPVGVVFKSPTFQFADTTWFFEFQSDEVLKNNYARDEYDNRIFRYNLVRLNSVIRQEIFCSIALLDANDKEYDYRSFATDIKEDENKLELGCFYYSDYPSFNRRETLCLIFELFCEKSTLSDEDEIQSTTNGDLETETKKEEKCNVTLGLSTRKSISSFVCTLKIPNFFILPEYDDAKFESPTLTFANATWCFRFASYKRWKSEENIRNLGKDFALIGAYIVRLDSEIPEQRFFYTITILDNNDKEYQKERGSIHFLEDNTGRELFEESNECFMWCCFHKPKPCFDRRDSLTFIISLFYDTSMEMEAHNLQKTIQRDIGTSTVDDFDSDEKDEKDIESEFEGVERLLQILKSVLLDKQNSAISSDIVWDLYDAADKYQMDGLKSECLDFIKNNLSVNNFCKISEDRIFPPFCLFLLFSLYFLFFFTFLGWQT